MLSLDECIGMSDLTEDEIAVIAEHERVPSIVAAGLGHHLLETPKGVFKLRCFIGDLLAQAKIAGNRDKAQHLDRVLDRFNREHPVPPVLTPPRSKRIAGFGFRRKRRLANPHGGPVRA
jgi:hypothetical protein